MDLCSLQRTGKIDSIKTIDLLECDMTISSSRPNAAITAQPARDAAPRRLIVTASVAIFAIRDWSLWLLLRDGPWGPPMRLVFGTESVADAVERTVDALLLWPNCAPLIQLKAG